MADGPRVSFDAFEEQPRQEFVKCVVVGDTSVGKTRLICSYVYDQPGIPVGSLYQRPRIPTVFAIDQYVRDPSIRDRARMDIQGVQTQFRIWDTFGYHDKNRKYAFQNAHVVVLCFNIGLPASLRNVNAKWYPEIKKYCPRAPIILVGTQLDRRYTDPNVFKSVSKVTTLTDILQHGNNNMLPVPNTTPELKCIPPQICRQTAREINADCYVEVSIVTRYGVKEVFEKAVRAALVYRKQQKPIFSSHLKHVRKPSLQKPFRPPEPEPPKMNVLIDEPCNRFSYFLTDDSKLCDITFLVEGELIHAHIIVLASGCPVFFHLLTHPNVLTSLGYNILLVDPPFPAIQTTSCYINGIAVDGVPQGFETIDILTDLHEKCKVFIKVMNISAVDFKCILEYVYTGKISFIKDPVRLLSAVEYLQMGFVSQYVSNILNHESYKNDALVDFHTRRCECMAKYFLKSSLFVDVAFLLENTIVPAHKHVLVSRCPMMEGMFRNNSFRESLMENVDFRDTNLESFLAVLEYLYTGDCREHADDLHGTLQLANFLCLPRLITFCEDEIVNRLKEMHESGNQEVYYTVIASFSLAQYHNAPQLAAWCLHFMATNYNDLCKESGKDMKFLDDETLRYLEENRWPPIWYLKEQDYYERSMKQLEKEQIVQKNKKRKRNFRSCFFT